MNVIELVLLIVALIAAIIATVERAAWPWLHVAVILLAIAVLIPAVPALSR